MSQEQQQQKDESGRLLREAIIEVRRRQVIEVQWALMRSEPRSKRLAMMETLHRPWIDKLRADHNWPVDAMVEMLLLTQGDEDEVDKQLAHWRAQTNGLEPGGFRDYQRFLTILHAQHQHRLHPLSGREADDHANATMHERYGKLSPSGHVVPSSPATQVQAVQQRLLMSTHIEKLTDLARKTGLGPAIIIEAYQAVAPYANPHARLLSLWEQWTGAHDNFPAFVRNEVRKHLGEQP